MLKSKRNTTRVEWSPGCFSWRLLDNKKASIKMEEISPGSRSDSHFHTQSVQFFFILEGEAAFKVGNAQYELKKHQGIEIPLKAKHQILNNGGNHLVFLLVSIPPVQEDDVRV